MPSRLVTPVYLTPVASLTINTSAPTMARSAESRTRPLMVPLGDCASAALTSRTIKMKSGRGQRSTRDAPGMHGFIQIHPVYGSPLAFVSSFFPETRWNVGWSYLRPPRIVGPGVLPFCTRARVQFSDFGRLHLDGGGWWVKD